MKILFLSLTVTGEEKWILFVNNKCKNQWLQFYVNAVPIQKSGLLPRKVLLWIWWTMTGIVHYELLDPGETILEDHYYQPLERVSSAPEMRWINEQ